MALTRVQSKATVSVGAVASHAAVFDSTPTSGNLLIAAASSNATLTMSSSGWTLIASVINFTGHYVWYKIAGGSESATVTVTPGASATTELYVEELSGNTATPLDKSATSNPGVNASSIASGTTAVTAQADEYAFASFSWNNTNANLPTMTALSNSFTEQADLVSIDAVAMDTMLGIAYKHLAATGAQSTTATLSDTAGRPTGIIATFLASGVTVHERTASLSATANIATVGQRDLIRSASLSATGAIATVGAFWSVLERVVSLSATGSIATVPQRVLQRSVALSALGTITITGPGIGAIEDRLAVSTQESTSGVTAMIE